MWLLLLVLLAHLCLSFLARAAPPPRNGVEERTKHEYVVPRAYSTLDSPSKFSPATSSGMSSSSASLPSSLFCMLW